MNLHQEISLKSIKNLFHKKPKSSGQLKTTINFVKIGEEKKTNWFLAVPGILLIAAGAVVLSKVAVTDRFAKLSRERSEVAALEAQIEAGMSELSGAGELTEQFYHYTWTGMTEEELSRASRVKITDLIRFINNQGLGVNFCSLSGTQLSMSVTGRSLDEISRVVALVRGQEIVDTASVSMAQTKEEWENASGGVDAQLNINIKVISLESEAGQQEDSAQ